MTIVCYDIGGTKKWYIRFYDMDTANGLDNTALESVAKTAYLDTFSNNPNTDVNSLVTTRNSPDGGYDTYSSRMWDVLRDSILLILESLILLLKNFGTYGETMLILVKMLIII